MRIILSAITLMLAVTMPALAMFKPQSSGEFVVSSQTLTQLEAYAATMSAGEWLELPTIDLEATLGEPSVLESILQYAQYLLWDPVEYNFYFLGAEHNDSVYFARYRSDINTWNLMPSDPWMIWTFGASTHHGNDHGALDPIRREIYYFRLESKTPKRYDMTTGVWSDAPTISDSMVPEYWNATYGVVWWPSLDSVVVFNENAIYRLNRATDTWSVPATIPVRLGYQTFAEYNPVHNVMLIGGGGDYPRKMFKVDSSFNVTALNDAPVDLKMTSKSTAVTVDPVSGDYLVLVCVDSPPTRCTSGTPLSQFYSYDILTDTWTLEPRGAGVAYKTLETTSVATPVPELGITVFVMMAWRTEGKVWLYKHAE